MCYYLCCSHRPTIRVHTGHDVYTCVITCAAAIAQPSGYILGMMCIHVLLPVLQPSPNHQGTYWGMMCIHVLLPVTSPNHHDVYTSVIICTAAIAQPSGFILGMMCIHVLLSVLQPSPNHQCSYWAWCVYMCYYLCCSHRPTIRVHTGHDVYTCVITCAAAITQPSGFILGMMCIHVLLPVL